MGAQVSQRIRDLDGDPTFLGSVDGLGTILRHIEESGLLATKVSSLAEWARVGHSRMSEAVRFSLDHGLPIKLDY